MPPTSVYFVCPRRIASTAACLIRSGVSKSGSPAPKEIPPTPRARSALALAWTASVDEGARVFRRSASTVALLRRSPAALPGGELLRQPLLDDRRHEPGDRGPEAGDLLDQPRGDVRVLLVRHEEDRLDGVLELAVHQRHLELVLEVRDRADAPHDAVGALAGHEVDEEAVQRDDGEVVDPRRRLVDHLEALLDGEQRLLRGVGHHRDDQLVEDPEAPLDDVHVAVVDGVEHPPGDRTPRPSPNLLSGSKESQGRLTEAARPERRHFTYLRSGGPLGQVLGHHEAARYHEGAPPEALEGLRREPGLVRRVEEDHVEPRAL